MTSGVQVIRYLDAHGIACALIGGVALSAHGIARATLDIDILVADRRVLDPAFWADLEISAAPPEIRRGDPEDPLLGVVRFAVALQPVDIVVGPSAWVSRILSRRIRITGLGQSLPVVDRADLILLKLFAGGPQDLLDVRLLLAAGTAELRNDVEARLGEAPPSVHALWRSVQPV